MTEETRCHKCIHRNVCWVEIIKLSVLESWMKEATLKAEFGKAIKFEDDERVKIAQKLHEYRKDCPDFHPDPMKYGVE